MIIYNNILMLHIDESTNNFINYYWLDFSWFEQVFSFERENLIKSQLLIFWKTVYKFK